MKLRCVAVVIVMLFMGGVASAQPQGRVEPFRFTVTDTAVFLGSCGDFDILFDDVALLHGMVRYNKAGVAVDEVLLFKIIGQTIYYNSLNRNRFVLGGPGEVQANHYVYEDGTRALDLISGLSFKVVLKGYGPAFFQTGHTVYNLQTGEVLFAAGHNQNFDADFAALCNALR